MLSGLVPEWNKSLTIQEFVSVIDYQGKERGGWEETDLVHPLLINIIYLARKIIGINMAQPCSFHIFKGELNPKIKFILFERTLKITD